MLLYLVMLGKGVNLSLYYVFAYILLCRLIHKDQALLIVLFFAAELFWNVFSALCTVGDSAADEKRSPWTICSILGSNDFFQYFIVWIQGCVVFAPVCRSFYYTSFERKTILDCADFL